MAFFNWAKTSSSPYINPSSIPSKTALSKTFLILSNASCSGEPCSACRTVLFNLFWYPWICFKGWSLKPSLPVNLYNLCKNCSSLFKRGIETSSALVIPISCLTAFNALSTFVLIPSTVIFGGIVAFLTSVYASPACLFRSVAFVPTMSFISSAATPATSTWSKFVETDPDPKSFCKICASVLIWSSCCSSKPRMTIDAWASVPDALLNTSSSSNSGVVFGVGPALWSGNGASLCPLVKGNLDCCGSNLGNTLLLVAVLIPALIGVEITLPTTGNARSAPTPIAVVVATSVPISLIDFSFALVVSGVIPASSNWEADSVTAYVGTPMPTTCFLFFAFLSILIAGINFITSPTKVPKSVPDIPGLFI